MRCVNFYQDHSSNGYFERHRASEVFFSVNILVVYLRAITLCELTLSSTGNEKSLFCVGFELYVEQGSPNIAL